MCRAQELGGQIRPTIAFYVALFRLYIQRAFKKQLNILSNYISMKRCLILTPNIYIFDSL